MRGFDPLDSFGEDVAAAYDRHVRGDEDETVRFLADAARGGPALEFAIGTGRIALPLAKAGIAVDGIEQSAAMIARLRAKPGGDDLAIVQGDMTRARLPARYRLVYLVFNTLFNVLTQDGQVRCSQNAAAHMADDGCFVVEAVTPGQFYAREHDGRVFAERVAAGSVTLEVDRFDRATQMLEENHVTLSPAGISVTPIAQRMSWPSELDLMARIAGLRLRGRWAGWCGEPFDGRSERHVSVYEKQFAHDCS